MKCEKCGTQIGVDEKSCPWCGEPVYMTPKKEEKTDSIYQTPIDPFNNYQPPIDPIPTPNPVPSPIPSKDSKVTPKYIGIIACAVLAVLVGFMLFSPSSDNTVYVTPHPYVEATPQPTPQPAHEHYYAFNVCQECGAAVTSLDNASGEFYGRLLEVENSNSYMKIELLGINEDEYFSEDATHKQIYYPTGKVFWAYILDSQFAVSYYYDDNYGQTEYETLGHALSFKSKHTNGKTLKNYLGEDSLDLYFWMENGTVTYTEVMYQR